MFSPAGHKNRIIYTYCQRARGILSPQLSPHLNPLPKGEGDIIPSIIPSPQFSSEGQGGYYPLNYHLTLILSQRARGILSPQLSPYLNPLPEGEEIAFQLSPSLYHDFRRARGSRSQDIGGIYSASLRFNPTLRFSQGARK